MMHTLNIENGVEVELNHDLNHMLHGSTLFLWFKNPQESVPRSFLLPYHFDELLAFLFDVSLAQTIVYAIRHTETYKGGTYLTGYSFYIVDSPNHQTSITLEFLDSITRWKEALDDRR